MNLNKCLSSQVLQTEWQRRCSYCIWCNSEILITTDETQKNIQNPKPTPCDHWHLTKSVSQRLGVFCWILNIFSKLKRVWFCEVTASPSLLCKRWIHDWAVVSPAASQLCDPGGRRNPFGLRLLHMSNEHHPIYTIITEAGIWMEWDNTPEFFSEWGQLVTCRVTFQFNVTSSCMTFWLVLSEACLKITSNLGENDTYLRMVAWGLKEDKLKFVKM